MTTSDYTTQVAFMHTFVSIKAARGMHLGTAAKDTLKDYSN